MPEGRKKPKKKTKSSPEWLLTYGDMTTLLLTFFVLMFTTAEIDGRELRLVLSAFQGSFSMLEGGDTLSKGMLVEMGMNVESLPAPKKGRRLDKARQQAMSLFKPEVKSRKVRVQEDERGLVISLTSDLYFEEGSSRINIKEAGGILKKVAFLMKGLPNEARVEGHTDDRPIAEGKRYESNWELSTGRAVFILKKLVELEVDPKKISASGYGKYRPIEENVTPEGRAYNRRVDIIIIRE